MNAKSLVLIASLMLGLPTVSPAKNQSKLTIPKIMQGEKFVGSLPSGQYWSEDDKYIYFDWNQEFNDADSMYGVSANGGKAQKISLKRQTALPAREGDYNQMRTRKVYSKNGDLFLLDNRSGAVSQITNTLERESSPVFSGDEKQIIFKRNGNLYAWEIELGLLTQITNFRSGQKKADESEEPKNENDRWLKKQERRLSSVLAEKLSKSERAEENNEELEPSRPLEIFSGSKRVSNQVLSPDSRYVTFRLSKEPKGATRTIVPMYVTESGYTEDLNSRTNVGSPQATQEFGIYDREVDSIYYVFIDSLPGAFDVPAYLSEYLSDNDSTSSKDKPEVREVAFHGPYWSPDGKRAVMVLLANDRKDRWIVSLEVKSGELTLLDRQHDDAWIGGPGVGWGIFWAGNVGWYPDSRHFWFQSEETGYSHLYSLDVSTGTKVALTSGNFEVDRVVRSHDGKYFYFVANIEHPGDWRVYRLSSKGGTPVKLTSKPGRYQFTLSPNEKKILLRYSYANEPWELFVMNNKPGAEMMQLTHSTTDEFAAYSWRDPEIVTFKARDGATVYARLYRPETPVSEGAAIVFVHGAGYLQNAHKWWSSYYREYMFHNFLADNGYTVIDIDFRASRGYGRDWRTAIYRNMGGKDLTDQVDGAKFLVENYGVDSARIGIYGGSYGGFITLMAMFKTPGIFAAGAGLRSVTDWAHYNHGYTQAILNTPQLDSLAYLRSSPIYFAEGLEGALLMCHGMIDDNVHFQDVVRLSQRLIELGKDNWELAVFPLERHSFKESSSWADEYKRVFKLFEENLNP